MASQPLTLQIDADALSIGDLDDLETARGVHQLIDWLVAHAGCDRAELRAKPARELRQIGDQVRAALQVAFDIPK